jgi:hypothetical protein
MTKNTPKIDEKQKAKLIEAIFADNPQLGKDSLQYYYIERMVESYLIDPDAFNRRTTEAMKEYKKKGKDEVGNKMPDEIVCISKVEAKEDEDGMKDVVVS